MFWICKLEIGFFKRIQKKLLTFFENLEIQKMIKILQNFRVTVVLPRATSVTVTERDHPPRSRWRLPRFSGVSGNLPLLFWAVLGRWCSEMQDLLVLFWSVSVRFSVVRVYKKDANRRGRFSASRSTQFPNIECLHLRKVDQNKTRKKGKTQEDDTKRVWSKTTRHKKSLKQKKTTQKSMKQKNTKQKAWNKITRNKKTWNKIIRNKKARVFMICQVHWRRFKFQISRLKFEVQSLTVLDPCWENRQNKLFKKCPRPFFTILSYIIFFPRKGRNARRAPWGRVSDSRCLNGEFFYITV